MQFDSVSVPVPQTRTLASGHKPRRKELLDGETVKQLSGGSLAGMFFFFPLALALMDGCGLLVVEW
jgi:hypothetical protein